jgi:hypothetical protein
MAMLQVRNLVFAFSLQRPGFSLNFVRVMNIAELGQDFICVRQSSRTIYHSTNSQFFTYKRVQLA